MATRMHAIRAHHVPNTPQTVVALLWAAVAAGARAEGDDKKKVWMQSLTHTHLMTLTNTNLKQNNINLNIWLTQIFAPATTYWLA